MDGVYRGHCGLRLEFGEQTGSGKVEDAGVLLSSDKDGEGRRREIWMQLEMTWR